MFWRNNTKVELLPYSRYHIDMIIKEGEEEPWRLTCVYREAQVFERHKTYNLLKFIKCSSAVPWLCLGDFNEVLHQSEHNGVQERRTSQISDFREMADFCGFCDLGCEGRSWTFEKKVAGGAYCRCVLVVHWRDRIGVRDFRPRRSLICLLFHQIMGLFCFAGVNRTWDDVRKDVSNTR